MGLEKGPTSRLVSRPRHRHVGYMYPCCRPPYYRFTPSSTSSPCSSVSLFYLLHAWYRTTYYDHCSIGYIGSGSRSSGLVILSRNLVA